MKAGGEQKIKMANTICNITHGKKSKKIANEIRFVQKKKTEIELHVYSDRD